MRDPSYFQKFFATQATLVVPAQSTPRLTQFTSHGLQSFEQPTVPLTQYLAFATLTNSIFTFLKLRSHMF